MGGICKKKWFVWSILQGREIQLDCNESLINAKDKLVMNDINCSSHILGYYLSVLSVRFEVGVSLLLAPAEADKRGPKVPVPLVENAGIQPAISKRVPAGAPAGAGSCWKHWSLKGKLLASPVQLVHEQYCLLIHLLQHCFTWVHVGHLPRRCAAFYNYCENTLLDFSSCTFIVVI